MNRPRSTLPAAWCGFVVALVGSPSPPAAAADEAAAAVRRHAAGARTHVVGIYQPAGQGRIDHRGVRDWGRLMTGLTADTPLGTALRAKMHRQDLESLKDRDAVSRLSVLPPEQDGGDERIKRALVARSVSALLDVPDLYSPGAFAGLKLVPEAQRLIDKGRGRNPLESRRLNRLLLSAAFPTALPPAPDVSDFARVRVGGREPVLLILTSYHACRWQVEVAPGTTLRAVVLSGYEWQDATGTDAPIVRRCRKDATGRDLTRDWFYAYDTMSREYSRLERGVRELTGHERFEFQGRYDSGTEPFVVPARP